MPIETVVPCASVNDDLPFWQGLGLRLDAIWPADDPQVALLSGAGTQLRLERSDAPAPRLRLTTRDADLLAKRALVSPSGVAVELDHPVPPMARPAPVTAPMVRRLRDGAPWVVGRAGMHYRDLVPDRAGGAMIASHIRIPEGGPVPDMVHYHTVGFQLIVCLRGWVDLVYKDRGPPFRLHAGSLVTQPPEIRHRVLHASDGLEVLEIGVPAIHVTTIDHDMTLPNGPAQPERLYGGQRFVHAVPDGAVWTPSRPGWSGWDTGVAAATDGAATVRILRPDGTEEGTATTDAPITFGFVAEGGFTLTTDAPHALTAGDAFALPAGTTALWGHARAGTRVVEVALG